MAWPSGCRNVSHLGFDNENENGGIVYTLKCRRKRIFASSEAGRLIHLSRMYKLVKLD